MLEARVMGRLIDARARFTERAATARGRGAATTRERGAAKKRQPAQVLSLDDARVPEPCDDASCEVCIARATLEKIKEVAPERLEPARLHAELLEQLLESPTRRYDPYTTMMELVHVLVGFSAHTNTDLEVPMRALQWVVERRKGHPCARRRLRTTEERGGWNDD